MNTQPDTNEDVSNLLDKQPFRFCICMFHLTILPVAQTRQHQATELQVNN